MEVIRSKELRGVMKHFWSAHWTCSSVARKKYDLFTVLKLNQIKSDPLGWVFVWGFWIQLLLLLIKVFSELSRCSPSVLFSFPSCFLSDVFLPEPIISVVVSVLLLTTYRLWSARSKRTLRWVVWQWGEWPLRISSLTGLVKTRGKDRINEAGYESSVACFQELCSSSSNWVFAHPGRVRGVHLKVQGALK